LTVLTKFYFLCWSCTEGLEEILIQNTRKKNHYPSHITFRGGLGPKSLRGTRFYKGHRDIAKKASIPLKMYFKNPHNPWKGLNFSEKVFKNNWNLYKSPTFLNRSLHFSGNVFEKPHYLFKIIVIFIKSSYSFLWKCLLKASLSLKKPQSLSKCSTIMKNTSIYLEIFKKKTLILWKSLTSC
jgi:hypothetical protein